MADDSDGDPIDWTIEQTLAYLTPRIDHTSLEKFRYHEVNGRVLLTVLSSAVLKEEIEIPQLGRRHGIIELVRSLQARSQGYADYILTEAAGMPLPAADIPIQPPAEIRRMEWETPRRQPPMELLRRKHGTLHIVAPFGDGRQGMVHVGLDPLIHSLAGDSGVEGSDAGDNGGPSVLVAPKHMSPEVKERALTAKCVVPVNVSPLRVHSPGPSVPGSYIVSEPGSAVEPEEPVEFVASPDIEVVSEPEVVLVPEPEVGLTPEPQLEAEVTKEQGITPTTSIQLLEPEPEPEPESELAEGRKGPKRIIPTNIHPLEPEPEPEPGSPTPSQSTDVFISAPNSPVIRKRGGERYHYFGNKAKPIESLFYDVDQDEEIMSEYESSDEFYCYNHKPKAPGEQRYVARQICRMHQIVGAVSEEVSARTLTKNKHLFRAVPFYLKPHLLLKKHEEPSVTTFTVETSALDIQTSFVRPVDKVKVHRKSSKKIGYVWPIDMTSSTAAYRNGQIVLHADTPEHNFPMLDRADNSIHDWDYLTKWQNTDGAANVLPLYGDSGSENEFDHATWNEITKENGDIQKVPGKSIRKLLTKEQMKEALEEGVGAVIERWQRKTLPRLEAKSAYKRWKRAKKDRVVKATISQAEQRIKSLTDRLTKQKDEILEGKTLWTHKDQIHKICRGNMELTITDREEEKWTVDLMNRPTEPARPERRVRKPSEQEIVEDGDDEDSESDFISSDEDEDEDEDDGEEGLDGFIVPDEGEPERLPPELLPGTTHQSSDEMIIDSEHEEEELDSDVDMLPKSRKSTTPLRIKPEKRTPSGKQERCSEIIDLTQSTPSPRIERPRIAMTDAHGRTSSPFVTPVNAKVIHLSSDEGEDEDNKPPFSSQPLFSSQPPSSSQNPPLRATTEEKRRHFLSQMLNNFDVAMQQSIYYRMRDVNTEKYFKQLFATINTYLSILHTTDRSEDDPDVNAANRVIYRALARCYICWFFERSHHKIAENQWVKQKDINLLDNITEFTKFSKVVKDILGPSIDVIESDNSVKTDNESNKWRRTDKGKQKAGKGKSKSKRKSGAGNHGGGKGTTLRFQSSDDDSDINQSNRKRKRKNLIEDRDAEEKRESQIKWAKNKRKRIQDAEKRAKKRGEQLYGGKLLINMGHYANVDDIELNDTFARVLMSHQIEGVRFMWSQLVETGKLKGALLAHTMGLGKTLQVIALLYTLACAGASPIEAVHNQIPKELRQSKTLILCPPGLVDNWIDEFHNWVPEIPGTDSDPPELDFRHLGRLFHCGSQNTPANRVESMETWDKEGGVLIMGYQMFRNFASGANSKLDDRGNKKARKILLEGPNIIIADEAHMFKNSKSQLFDLAKQFKSNSRIAMTGSPLSNNLQEYWSMIEWIEPGFLGPLKYFNEKYVKPVVEGLWADSTRQERKDSQKALWVLKKDIGLKMHRADIGVIADYMPNKREFLVRFPLTDMQAEFYKKYVEDPGVGFVNERNGYASISDRKVGNNLFIAVYLMGLICGHPMIFVKNLEDTEKKKKEKYAKMCKKANDVKGKAPQSPPNEDSDEEAISDDPIMVGESETSVIPRMMDTSTSQDLSNRLLEMDASFPWARKLLESYDKYDSITQSYKMMALRKIIELSLEMDDQVLVFSHFIPTLDAIEVQIKSWGITYMRLDGSTPTGSRQKKAKDFNKKSCNVFIISTEAGGLGLNLPGANRVILFDFKWSPMWEQQAIGRAYRLGQKKDIFVYRFVCGGTFEDSMWNTTQFKVQLSSRVVDTKEPTRQARKESVKRYLNPPQPIERQDDLEDYKGLDKVLDNIMSTTDYIYGVSFTETFVPDKDDELTPDELKEAEQMHQAQVEERKRLAKVLDNTTSLNPITFGHDIISKQLIQEQEDLLAEAANRFMGVPGPSAPAASVKHVIESLQELNAKHSTTGVIQTPPPVTSTRIIDMPVRANGQPLSASPQQKGFPSSAAAATIKRVLEQNKPRYPMSSPTPSARTHRVSLPLVGASRTPSSPSKALAQSKRPHFDFLTKGPALPKVADGSKEKERSISRTGNGIEGSSSNGIGGSRKPERRASGGNKFGLNLSKEGTGRPLPSIWTGGSNGEGGRDRSTSKK